MIDRLVNGNNRCWLLKWQSILAAAACCVITSQLAEKLYSQIPNPSAKFYSPKEIARPDSAQLIHGELLETEGTILWINPFWGACLVAQPDDAQAVFVSLKDKQGHKQLTLGSKIRVVGKGTLWEGHTNITEATIISLGEGKRPAPVPVPDEIGIETLDSIDCQYVTVVGKVRYVYQHFDRYIFWIEGYDLPIRAEFRDIDKKTVGIKFAGATVRVTGVAMQRGGEKRGRRKLVLKLNQAADLKILQSAPNWKTDPDSYGINAVVVCRKANNRFFFRADSREIVDAELYETEYLTVGDMVRFVGKEVRSADGKKTEIYGLESYTSAKDWVLGERQPLEVVSAANHQFGDWAILEGVTGQQVSQELNLGWFGITNAAGETFRVEISTLEGDINTLQLENATNVSVVGYLDFQDNLCLIYPRNFADIRVTGRLSWYQSRTVQWLGTAIAIVLLASLLSSFFLRTMVRQRTRALENSTGLLNASYDAILEGICLIDNHETIQKANPRFWQLIGLEPAIANQLQGDALRDCLANCFRNPESFRQFWSELKEGQPRQDDYTFERQTGSAEILSVYTVPASAHSSQQSPATPTSRPDNLSSPINLGRVWVFHDLTQQRRLEQSLLQAQKMEAVGRLAGGIAHDFNNMLAGISGNLSVAKLKFKRNASDAEDYVDAAESAVWRAAKLVKSLVGFSRQSTMDVKPGNANDVVRSLITLLRPTLDPQLRLEADLEDELGLARFDAIELEQVLLNLVVNARDATLANGGLIRIQSRNAQAAPPRDGSQQADASLQATGERIDCVELSVADNGSGMTPEVAAKVFEPFFSTKEQGKGTGLGLATSHGVIQQLGGWIVCESTLGEGTTFRIFLPAVGEEHSQKPGTQFAQELTEEDNVEESASELSILCVDDEQIVRNTLVAMLQSLGYNPSTAVNGQDALDQLAEQAASVDRMPDLVLLDKAMPVLSGVDTLPLIRESYPDLPVVLCSGFLADLDNFTHEAGSAPDGFLQKPFQMHQLKEVLESVAAKV